MASPTDDGFVIRSAGESVRSRQHWSGTGREGGATLGTASREDGTAGAGAHAKAEAVLLGTTTVVGLEGALAHWESLPDQVSPGRSDRGLLVQVGLPRGHRSTD